MKVPAWNRFADRSRKGRFAALSSPLGSDGTGAPSIGRLAGSFALFASVVALAISAFAGTGASSALAAEACPNEALRAENNSLNLADCRAFERVTPVFQNGFGEANPEALAPNGEELVVTAVAGFAGAESNRLGPFYKLTRTNGGWETASISPSGTTFPGNSFYAASEDLQRSLWALRSPNESVNAQNLYVREPDGTFVEIGSMVPPSSLTGQRANGSQFFLGDYAFAGASADLSHVDFSILNGVAGSVVWPGDTTATVATGALSSSLYEYVGVSNTRPALVGVETQGRLISDCATYLGSDEARDVYNAISADGAITYFTAEGHSRPDCHPEIHAPEVNELYARLRGQETVSISEPSLTDCKECQTKNRQPAQFWGASENGEKSFFTTSQELLSGAETTNLYEYDFGAPRQVRVTRLSVGAIASEVLGVVRVSEDGSHVYFVARGRLTETPRDGCIAEETPSEQTEEEETHEGRCRPKQGEPNLYVYARNGEHPLGHVGFVGTLAAGDEEEWLNADNRTAQATPDGVRLVFDSFASLAPGVAGGLDQVFEYDASSEELVRVSRGQNGFPQGTFNADNSGAETVFQPHETFLRPAFKNTRLSISVDGSEVQFHSPGALTPTTQAAAESGATSVYEYRSSGPISNGNVFPLSGPDRVATSTDLGLAPDGRNAFLKVAEPLVVGQTDQQPNIFDARVGGGFPAPVTASGCSGEHCLEAGPQPPPETPPPASLAVTSGNGKTASSSGSQKALKSALNKCRRKTTKSARQKCEKQARKKSQQPRHSSQVKGG